MAKVTKTFSLNTEADRDLVDWLSGQRNASQSIRDALRLAIRSPSAQPGASVNLDTMLDELLDMVRATVEAVLDERLASTTLGVIEQRSEDEDPDVAAKLDAMF